MAFKNISIEKEENIAMVGINRPPMNLLNTETLMEMRHAFDELEQDWDIKVVIITGRDNVFVGGAEIDEIKDKSAMEGLEFARLGKSVCNQIESLPQPVVAAVNGVALGCGTELALSCNIVIASMNAKFGLPEVGIGIIPGFGGTQRLPRLIGKAKGMELIFTGDLLGAHEASKIGLVSKVVEPEELMQVAKNIAKKIANNGPLAIRLAKFVINNGLSADFRDGLALESEAFGLCFSTEDQKEGMSAFSEKRKPVFSGKHDLSFDFFFKRWKHH